MKFSRKWIVGSLILIGGLVFLGTRNQLDPNWIALDQKLDQQYFTLDIAQDSLFQLLQTVQGDNVTKDDVKERIANPFLPTMEFQKFQFYVQEVLKEKFTVFTSISGSGTSTLTDRLAKFIATKESNILRAVGTPNFDLIYHHRFIGEERNGKFQRGELLEFFDKCNARPDENFVFVFDDIDKIEPETFFGPLFWYKLYQPEFELNLHGETIEIPENFYMISVGHIKPTAKVILTDDHFRRLGKNYQMQPNQKELILFLQSKLAAEGKKLSNFRPAKELVYSFSKLNELISKDYNGSYCIGQWSPIRKLYGEGQLDEVLDYAAFHVNAFNPRKEIKKSSFFSSINYTIENDGKMRSSNFFSRQFKTLEEKGFLTEFIVGLSFIVFSAIFSLLIFRRREKIISQQIKKVEELFNQFENKSRDYDVISKEIFDVKRKVDELALNKKINYEEATFFYQYFYDKSRKVEIAKEAYHHFNDLVEVSLEDGILSEYEYQKLLNFLRRIKARIGREDYLNFQNEIERIYKENRAN